MSKDKDIEMKDLSKKEEEQKKKEEEIKKAQELINKKVEEVRDLPLDQIKQKMSRIGTKISKFNEDLICDFERLERVNLFDQDTIKLYAQYLSEILNNHTLANTYNNKLNERNERRIQ